MCKVNSFVCCFMVLFAMSFSSAWAKKAEVDVSAISLDVLRIDACARGKGCVAASGPMQLNLLDLADGKVDFASKVLLPAQTKELRLVLGDNNTITVDDESFPLEVPSGKISGLKLKGQKVFGKEGGFLSALTLSLDLKKQLVVQAKKIKAKGHGKGKKKSDVEEMLYSFKLKPVVWVKTAEVDALPDGMVTAMALPDENVTLTLGDDFSMLIPAGAVVKPTLLAADKVQYPIISNVVNLFPEGMIFSIPVQLRITYFPDTIPGDYPESELVILHDFHEIQTQVDLSSKRLAGEISHFSSTRGGVKEKVPVKIGQITYERRNKPPVHIIYFDKNANNYELRLLWDMNPDKTLNLKTISDLASGKNVLAAINGFTWSKLDENSDADKGKIPGGKGRLLTTTIKNDILVNKISGSEVLLGLGRNENGLLLRRMTTDRTPDEYGEFEQEFHNEFGIRFSDAIVGDRNDNPTIDNILHNLFGSTTTLMEYAPFMQAGACKGEDKIDWWSAIGYSKDKVVMISSDLSNYFTTTVSDRYFCSVFEDFGVTDAVRLDGGAAASMYYKDPNNVNRTTGYHVNPMTDLVSDMVGYGPARYIAYAIGLVESPYVHPDGLYCGRTDIGQFPDTLYSYANNEYEVYRQCAHGCDRSAQACVQALDKCPLGNGSYCGNSNSIVNLSLNSDTLYKCENGAFWVEKECANGCEEMGAGTNDECRSCKFGTGYYCGSIYPSLDDNMLYYCQQDGVFTEDEQCANGCQENDNHVNDQCKGSSLLPVVDSVAPDKATLNELTTFTVTGQNLPSTLAFWIGECENVTSLGGTSTSMKFSCTPSWTTGEKDGVVKDEPGGTVLKEFTVNVSEGGSTLPESSTCTSGSQTQTWQGLEWQRCDDGNTYTWQEAKDYCDNLVLGGYSDWRLPTNDELRSIVYCSNGTETPLAVYPDDPSVPYSCNSHNSAPYDRPTISSEFECKSEPYWSSTPYSKDPSYTLTVDFDYGYSSRENPTLNHFYVRCVR